MIIIIPLERIDSNRYQTRQSYDPDKIAELAQSIEALTPARSDTMGLIHVPTGRIMNGQYIVATDNPAAYLEENPKARVELAAGHRRLMAFENLDREAMPVDIVSFSNPQMADIAFEENAKRDDITAIDEALAIKAAMETFGYSQKEIAARWGLSESAISNKMRLLELPKRVQNLILTGALGERHAREILPLVQIAQDDKTAIAEAERAAKNGQSADFVRRVVENHIKAQTSAIDPDMLEWDDWRDGWPDGCESTCKLCPRQTRGRCASPENYTAKYSLFVDRLLDLASAAAGVPADRRREYHTLDKDQAERALADGCKNLRVCYRKHADQSSAPVQGIPGTYYTCSDGWACSCIAQAQKDMAAGSSARETWEKEQRAAAIQVGKDLLDWLAHRFDIMLDRTSEQDATLLRALVQTRNAPKDEPLSVSLARQIAWDVLLFRKEGEALLCRAKIEKRVGATDNDDGIAVALAVLINNLVDYGNILGRSAPVADQISDSLERISGIEIKSESIQEKANEAIARAAEFAARHTMSKKGSK